MNPTRRPFRLSDAMALVIATAIGLLAYRLQGVGIDPVLASDFAVWLPWILDLIVSSIPMLTAWALALLLLRLAPPRVPVRRLARRPGFVACVAIVVGAMFGLALLFVIFVVTARYEMVTGRSIWNYVLEYHFRRSLAFLCSHIGCAIAVAWLCLLLRGRPRAPSDWMERAGRAIGTAWVGLSLFCGAYYFFMGH